LEKKFCRNRPVYFSHVTYLQGNQVFPAGAVRMFGITFSGSPQANTVIDEHLPFYNSVYAESAKILLPLG
jgi:hypothetical protein